MSGSSRGNYQQMANNGTNSCCLQVWQIQIHAIHVSDYWVSDAHVCDVEKHNKKLR